MERARDGFIRNLEYLLKLYKSQCFQSVKEYGFSPNEIDVLMFLANNAPLDTATDICRYRNISKALVCRSVESLCRRDMISTKVDRHDGRVVHLILKDNTRVIVDQLRESRDVFIENVLRGVSAEDEDALGRINAFMVRNIGLMKAVKAVESEELDE